MADDWIDQHIKACSERPQAEAGGPTARIMGAGQSGGGDRSQPAALQWVRRWRPAPFEATLQTCSCPAGRCSVCN